MFVSQVGDIVKNGGLVPDQWLRASAGLALLADSGATSNSAGDNSGLDVFGKLVEPYPQIVLTLCGHTYGDGRRTDTTKLGVTTHAVLANYRDDPNGGNGWMQRLRFVPAQSRLEVRTFSPSFTPGLTPGPNRALAPEGNFDLDLDLEQHIEDLLATTTLHFSRGFDHGFGVYGGALDTHVGNGASGVTLPGVSYGAADTLRVDLDDDREQALLRFDDIIGSSPGQIPPGATIQRAILPLTSEGQGAATLTGAALHRMLIPWSEASTWNSLGAGVQLGAEGLDQAHQRHPERFVRGSPAPQRTPGLAWINPPARQAGAAHESHELGVSESLTSTEARFFLEASALKRSRPH